LSAIGKITHLCNPPEPVMRALIYASRTVPEWDCTFLRGKGVRKWRARKRPPLDPEIAAKRLACAIARKDWTEEDFEGVIWSDECSVERGKTATTVWVFCSAGGGYQPECVVLKR